MGTVDPGKPADDRVDWFTRDTMDPTLIDDELGSVASGAYRTSRLPHDKNHGLVRRLRLSTTGDLTPLLMAADHTKAWVALFPSENCR